MPQGPGDRRLPSPPSPPSPTRPSHPPSHSGFANGLNIDGPPSAIPSPAQPPSATGAPAPANPRILRALQNAHLLKGFTETGIQILATIAQEKTLPERTPLFVENMIGEALYVIAEGRLRISARGPDGREHQLVVLEAGDSLGEAALLRTGPRMCSATAEVSSVVIEISRRDVANLQRTKPQACLKLMMNVADLLGARMREADGDLKKMLGWHLG